MTLSAAQRKNVVKCAVETGGGKEGVSRKGVKKKGKEPYLRGMWEYFLQERSRVKRFRELADEEKAGRNTRSVAAGIDSQRKLGASEMLP